MRSAVRSEREPADRDGVAPFACHGVRRTSGALEELDGDSIAVSIPLQTVGAVRLRFGSAGERPVPAVMLGVVLAVFGAVACIRVATWLFERGTMRASVGLAAGLLPLGIGLVHMALKRRYFLLVAIGRGDTRKLVFDNQATRDEVQRFASQLGALNELDSER
jgi:hypothetical protein